MYFRVQEYISYTRYIKDTSGVPLVGLRSEDLPSSLPRSGPGARAAESFESECLKH